MSGDPRAAPLPAPSGRRFQHGVCDSTSERAFADLARGRARHGDAHLAEAQTDGRGRRGRRWFSPPGEGLYLSVVLLPGPPPFRPPVLVAAVSLAVLDTLRASGLTRARLKWPNDLVVSGRKLAGILIETRGLDPGQPHYVAGIGLNVAQRAFPAELARERAVTSLALEGIPTTPARLADAILERLNGRLEAARCETAELAAEFAAAADLNDAEVVLAARGRTQRGRLVHFALDGEVEVAGPDGASLRVPVEVVDALRPA